VSGRKLEVICETVGVFAENSYFLVAPETREAVAIDPGDEPERLLGVIRAHDLQVRLILNTHGHLDHVGAVAALREATGAPFYIHEGDWPFIASLAEQAAMFDLPPPPAPEIDGGIAEGQVFELKSGAISIRTFGTPGHSPGSVTLEVGGRVFSGDVLFAGGIGRTDLPGGDLPTLMRSIHERLLTLPDETIVHPGHGPSTTIGRERRSNPFLS
jgi:glyoxylase-like metal-dependent hydrolase (beta-lactamase superfamily II)